MDRHIIFVSYAHEDDPFATAFKELIEDAFIGTVDVFVSSDSINPGDPWLDVIRDHLQKAQLYISVLSPISVDKRWVLFEAGSAVGRGVRLIPVCIRGLRVDDLESPFKDFQALHLDSVDALQRVIRRIAEHFNCGSKPNSRLLKKTLELAREEPDDLPPPLSAAARQREPEFLGEALTGITELMSMRQTFWETLDEIYVDYRIGRRGYPETIRTLAEAAEPPQGLPLPPDEHLRDYPTRHGLALRDEARRLFDFCCVVYPAKQEGKTLGQCSIIADEKFDSFHRARSAHAQFWRQIGQKIYLSRVLELKSVIAEFSAQRPMVNLLTYLEIALVQWTQDQGPGKSWLFRLNRDWSRLTRDDMA